MPRLVRNYRFDKLRQGDSFFSRTKRVYARVIVYATCWEDNKDGRRKARAAAHNQNVPNHGGNVQNNWGQKYPVEAGPRGYEQNNFDKYRTRRCHIVSVYRWRGFDDPEKRKLSAQVLELWSRRTKRKRYDLWGAIVSSNLGRRLFPWKRNDPNRLFCTEGVLYLHIICGLLGYMMPYNIRLLKVRQLVGIHHGGLLPASDNPVDLEMWMDAHPDFTKVQDYIA